MCVLVCICVCVCVCVLTQSCVILCNPMDVANQVHLSLELSRQEYLSGLPLPSSHIHTQFSSVQFSSIAQSCLTLCDPMNRSTPCLSVHHQLPEFTQTHVHRVSDAIQPSHTLSSPSPPAPIPLSIRVFSNESALRMRWPKY